MVILEDSWISLNILEYFWILLSMLKKSRLAARLKLPCGNLDRPKKSRKSCCHSFWCASMLGNVSLPHCHDKDLSFTCLFCKWGPRFLQISRYISKERIGAQIWPSPWDLLLAAVCDSWLGRSAKDDPWATVPALARQSNLRGTASHDRPASN